MINTMTQKIILTIALILYLGLLRCGSNVYEILDPADPGEEAVVLLEKQKPDQAIEVLEKALGNDPENPTYLSLLASAKAQLAGVDTIVLALRLISNSNDQDNNENAKNDIAKLFDIMPPASQENINLLAEAVNIMGLIAEAKLLTSDRFKLSMFFISLMTLRTKSLDLDGDGSLSPEELGFLDNEMAAAILADLIAAETSSTDKLDAGDVSGGEATAKVGSIRSKIDSQEGADDAERLRKFLAS